MASKYSVGTFSEQISGFADLALEAIDKATKEVLIVVGSNIIIASPVDTGAFKANWRFAAGTAPSGTLPDKDKDGGPTIQKLVAQINSFEPGQVAYIVNNLPYAAKLEFGGYNGPTELVTEGGFSRQAPKGMVRVTLARFQQIVDEAAARNRV